MITGTDRRRFPILFAAIAALGPGGHRARPALLHGAGAGGLRTGQARAQGWETRATRPAQPSLALLPALRRDALHPPRRLRHPARRPDGLALLPGVGAPRRAPRHDGGAAGPYYSSHRPTDDHGAQPAVLVVFDDDLAATHFLRVAVEEMNRTRTALPLLVSHRGLLEPEGPLGRTWLGPGRRLGAGPPVARPLNINESEGPRNYVRSALGVDAERWNDLFRRVQDSRLELRDRYGIPADRELHACDLQADASSPAAAGMADGSPANRGSGLPAGFAPGRGRRTEHGCRRGHNVCLRKPDAKGTSGSASRLARA